ncbi:MAG: hypothetical protein JXB29_02645 [Sedimentisphaerales bacterium]|nr:hypothetical protein [Sedimentisphaerales bacterium]
MKLPFRKKRTRGKQKSPEVKAREAQARTEQLLANQWYRLLKDDPELAASIARQKYALPEPSASGNNEQPDLLEVLRQAKEAKDLIKDELGTTDNKSWIRDLAEIIKVLPQAMQAAQQQGLIGQVAQQSRQSRQPPQIFRHEQLSQAQQQPAEQKQEQVQLKLESLLPLLEMEPAEAIEFLSSEAENDQQVGMWLGFLATTDYQTIVTLLNTVQDPDLQPYVEQLLANDRKEWLEEVLKLAKEQYSNLKK